MIDRALSVGDQQAGQFSSRILDPSCGDGAFVLPLLDWIASHRNIDSRDETARLTLVRDHVFGVDADPLAIESLHRRVAEWVHSGASCSAETAAVLNANFLCGDSLVGEDWSGATPEPANDDAATADNETVLRNEYSVLSTQCSETTQPQLKMNVPRSPRLGGSLALPIQSSDRRSLPIQWSTAFPTVAADGGFDLIIGNPPYLRELNAKATFDRIAASPLGQRWRAARMDLWHYFCHRGLDLLKPGGRLSFIVNSYWTNATAAKRLRDRLAAETSFEELVFLGSAKLFQDVSGRHMIFRTRKVIEPETQCNVLDMSGLSPVQIETAFSRCDNATARPHNNRQTVRQANLWSGGQLRVHSITPRKESSGPLLGEVFEVRQGIAENPPFVTKAVAQELGEPAWAGRGVFVLTNDEVDSMNLSPHERSLLRPYYALSAVHRYHVAVEPTHQILYLTRHTAADLQDIPRIAGHLEKFRTILQRRREALSGKIAWWHLHWPREERLFTAPRVLCLQMGSAPTFALAYQPTYVGFSMHLIVERPEVVNGQISLPTLTAILNSQHARCWFESYAKRRGAHLDISGTILKQFPLPASSQASTQGELDHLVRNQRSGSGFANIDAKINALVDQLHETERGHS